MDGKYNEIAGIVDLDRLGAMVHNNLHKTWTIPP